jgi:predicted amidophosphoribosyltransferase
MLFFNKRPVCAFCWARLKSFLIKPRSAYCSEDCKTWDKRLFELQQDSKNTGDGEPDEYLNSLLQYRDLCRQYNASNVDLKAWGYPEDFGFHSRCR